MSAFGNDRAVPFSQLVILTGFPEEIMAPREFSWNEIYVGGECHFLLIVKGNLWPAYFDF